MIRYASLASLLLLAACGPSIDNPSNLPKLGKWERESKLVALVANDVWIDRKDAPFQLPPDQTEVKDCFEPTLKSQREINRDMLANTDQMCRLEGLEQKGGLITSTGTCGPTEKSGMTITGTIEFNGVERENYADATVSVLMHVKGREGSSERVRAAYSTKWRRIGDCRS
ncbi:DUF3617 family protein [Sphingomonas sp. AOB5]|uniref:DUF3617 domain-containing protein n=1 Tax=Sphingomonas sp. AOB5 TaxID=3034017 RepID=UPI0023F9CD0C|nr:DUF3617 family protein [Sphingomonas sp. AOB5]MDF7776632.1 DUF3617 family protein [Sphingomonas sp. AOB5]